MIFQTKAGDAIYFREVNKSSGKDIIKILPSYQNNEKNGELRGHLEKFVIL